MSMTSYRIFKNGFVSSDLLFLSLTTFNYICYMKLTVSNKKHVEDEKPVRGFIEAKDIKLLIFTNSNKSITKFELTLGGKAHTFKDDRPFILWSQVENAIDIYLTETAPQEEQDKLKGVGKKVTTRKNKRL